MCLAQCMLWVSRLHARNLNHSKLSRADSRLLLVMNQILNNFWSAPAHLADVVRSLVGGLLSIVTLASGALCFNPSRGAKERHCHRRISHFGQSLLIITGLTRLCRSPITNLSTRKICNATVSRVQILMEKMLTAGSVASLYKAAQTGAKLL